METTSAIIDPENHRRMWVPSSLAIAKLPNDVRLLITQPAVVGGGFCGTLYRHASAFPMDWIPDVSRYRYNRLVDHGHATDYSCHRGRRGCRRHRYGAAGAAGRSSRGSSSGGGRRTDGAVQPRRRVLDWR